MALDRADSSLEAVEAHVWYIRHAPQRYGAGNVGEDGSHGNSTWNTLASDNPSSSRRRDNGKQSRSDVLVDMKAVSRLRAGDGDSSGEPLMREVRTLRRDESEQHAARSGKEIGNVPESESETATVSPQAFESPSDAVKSLSCLLCGGQDLEFASAEDCIHPLTRGLVRIIRGAVDALPNNAGSASAASSSSTLILGQRSMSAWVPLVAVPEHVANAAFVDVRTPALEPATFFQALAAATVLATSDILSVTCENRNTDVNARQLMHVTALFHLLLRRGHSASVTTAFTSLATSGTTDAKRVADALGVLVAGLHGFNYVAMETTSEGSPVGRKKRSGATSGPTKLIDDLLRLGTERRGLLPLVAAVLQAISHGPSSSETISVAALGWKQIAESLEEQEEDPSSVARQLFLMYSGHPLLKSVFPRRVISAVVDEVARRMDGDSSLSSEVRRFPALRSLLLSAWADKEEALYAGEESHTALADAVMICLESTTRADLQNGDGDKTSKATLTATLLDGVSARLGSPSEVIRKAAALIAVAFSRLESSAIGASSSSEEEGGPAPGVQPVKFDAFPTVLEDWRAAAGGPDSSDQSSAITSEPSAPTTEMDELAERKYRVVSMDPDANARLFPLDIEVSRDDDWAVADTAFRGEGGALVATDASSDQLIAGGPTVEDPGALRHVGPIRGASEDKRKSRGVPKFTAFRAAYDALVSPCHPGEDQRVHDNGVEGAIRSIPSILDRPKNVREVAPLAAQTLRSLVALALPFPPEILREVQAARDEAIARVIAAAPPAALQEVQQSIYSHNYSIHQRCMLIKGAKRAAELLANSVVDGMTGGKDRAAREFHEGTEVVEVVGGNQHRHVDAAKPPRRVYPPIPSAPSEKAYQEHVRASRCVIDARVEAKTRRWGHAVKERQQRWNAAQEHKTENAFADSAEVFVAALVLEHDSGHFSLLKDDDDVYVASALLAALSTFATLVKPVRHIVADVCRKILPATLGLVHHAKPLVRTQSWAAVFTVIQAWVGSSQTAVLDRRWVALQPAVEDVAVAAVAEGPKQERDVGARRFASQVLASLHFVRQAMAQQVEDTTQQPFKISI